MTDREPAREYDVNLWFAVHHSDIGQTFRMDKLERLSSPEEQVRQRVRATLQTSFICVPHREWVIPAPVPPQFSCEFSGRLTTIYAHLKSMQFNDAA